MRTRTVATLVLMLALGSAGCGRNSPSDPQVASAQDGVVTPSSSPSASASYDPDAALKFARCMREQGLTWFPDPQGGQMAIEVPKGVTKEKMDAAHKACQKYMPNGGEMLKPNAEDLEKVRQMAKCMRENGVPNFPDPNPDGGLALDSEKLGTGPGDPTFDKAEEACAQYRPEGARGEKHVDGGGSTGGGSGGFVGGGKA